VRETNRALQVKYIVCVCVRERERERERETLFFYPDLLRYSI